MLELDPSNSYIIVYERVDKIHLVDQWHDYEVHTLDLPKATGIKLMDLYLQPMKKLNKVNFWNYHGEPQTVDLDMFRKLNGIYFISLYNEKIIEIENSAEKCILQNLETLDLSYNLLTDFNLGTISCFTKLKKLELNDNKIVSISNSPDGACHWPNLEIIRLSSNKLKQFDPSFFSCSRKLTKLWLRSNLLYSFGEGVPCYWPHLTSLWIYNNKLEFFNENFLNCSKKLEDLRLSKNKLASFGPIMTNGNCRNGKLQILDLSDNQMTSVDFQQFNCSKELRAVYLDNNLLTTMNISLSKSTYPSMFRFDITANNWNCTNLEKIVRDLEHMNFTYECDKNCCGKLVHGICCFD